MRRRPFRGQQQRRTVHLDLSCVDVTLIDRLENWGRSVRITIRQGISNTGEICDALARQKGEIDQARTPRDELNAVDAALVERGWRQLPRREKELLRGWYVLRQHQAATCRVLGLRRSEFMDCLVRAHWTMGSVIAVLDAGVYKAAQHHPNPSADPERHSTQGDARPVEPRAPAIESGLVASGA